MFCGGYGFVVQGCCVCLFKQVVASCVSAGWVSDVVAFGCLSRVSKV